jgi:hypothetical protein
VAEEALMLTSAGMARNAKEIVEFYEASFWVDPPPTRNYGGLTSLQLGSARPETCAQAVLLLCKATES